MHKKSRVKEWNERNKEVEFRTPPWRQWEGNAHSMVAHVLPWVFGSAAHHVCPTSRRRKTLTKENKKQKTKQKEMKEKQQTKTKHSK